jgi:putative protease
VSIQLPELLIPAGTFRKLQVAFEYGADAVYVGAAGFSMRPDQVSFAGNELEQAVAFTHQKNKRIYVGINSLIMQDELDSLQCFLIETKHIPFDALIVADPGAFMLVREIRPDVEIHISTQMSTANALAAKFWKEAGASRVVLARECSLAETKQITHTSELPVEIFVHGTMCMAVSGRCLLSAYTTGHNASKGDCKNTCRWQWEVTESKRPDESFPVLQTEKNTVIFSSKDLCLLDHIPEVVQSGAASLKIEGRMKSEYYVGAVTRAYRAALDLYVSDPAEYVMDPDWLVDVNSVRHHPYSTGFAFGYPREAPESLQSPKAEPGTYDFVGIIDEVKDQSYLVDIKNPIVKDETLEWIGPGSGRGLVRIESMIDRKGDFLDRANPGNQVYITLAESVPLPKHILLRRLKEIPIIQTV